MTKFSHRGPDAEGFYFDSVRYIGLGHKRLIDSSENANQPMTSHCDRYILVYNGEVYNYNDIAQDLNNIKWKTKSDSEVILEAFVRWGIDFVHKINGMFSIVIYDKKRRKFIYLEIEWELNLSITIIVMKLYFCK